MEKCFINNEKKSSITMIMLLFSIVLILIMNLAPAAQADVPSMWLDPSQGPSGISVIVHVRGLPGPTLDITFDTISLGTATTWPGTNNANRAITVPQVPSGTYTISAASYAGVATATFTVTQGGSPTVPETADDGATGSGPKPTNPSVIANTGYWSPLTIGLVLAVIAGAFFGTTLYVKRGRQQIPKYQENSQSEPGLIAPSKKANEPLKTNQLINYSQQPPLTPYTKICRHCKQTVRDDLNVCPHCFKRLR